MNIKNSIINTFPNIIIKIKLKVINNNIFKRCTNYTYDDINLFYYSNPIFSFELINNKLIFKTKYLSPCMFLLNKYYKSYNYNDNYYYIELNNLT